MPQEEKSTLGISPKKRLFYQEKIQLKSMCRVCLTKSNIVMYDLSETFLLNDDFDVYVDSSIQEALEKITASKISLCNSPRYICPICFSILKIAYKFIHQFEESQEKLKEILNENEVVFEFEDSQSSLEHGSEYKQNIPKCETVAPVELIVGENKYSLKDLLVVEKPEEEQCDFSGFLNNLGTEVSATFADENKPELSHLYETENNNISVSLIEKDKVLQLKELEVDEETNSVQFLIETYDEEVVQFEIENDDEEVENFENDEEVLKFEIEKDDDDDDMCDIRIDLDVDIDSLIVENDVKKVAENLFNERKSNLNVENNDEIDCDLFNNESIEIELDNFDVDALNIANEVKKTDENIQKKDISNQENVENNSDVDDTFEKEIKFPCEICGKIFDYPSRLKEHKRRTHSKKTKVYYCDICGYQNNTLSAHKNHKTRHGGKQWICEFCSKSYYTKAVLKAHLVTHTESKQHLCTVCGKGFHYSNALVYHMRLHTGEKNYLCKYCGQMFRMPNSLNRHLRCHTGERPYRCQFCEKAFRSKGELKCHESGHTGDRPYHCTYCRKGFSKTHNLKMHLLSHDGPHKCDFCARNFMEPAILAMHYKVTHRDVIECRVEVQDKEEK